MQIVSLGDDLHEMSNPVFWKNKKKIVILSFAEFAWRAVKTKEKEATQLWTVKHNWTNQLPC